MDLRDKKPDVSVVVPVYNTAEFLEECIESLVHQTLKNIELIFVDDGSTDNSVEIIEKYQANDDRITILKQRNQFAGVARNNGMEYATGKYIIFLDSDDFFDLNMLEETFKCAESHRAEIVLFDFCTYDNVTNKEKKYSCGLPQTQFSSDDLGADKIRNGQSMPWNKLLLLSFVKKTGVKYQELQSCNDEFFNRMIFMLARRIMYINKVFVHYRVNNIESLQGKGRKKGIAKYINNVVSAGIALKKSMQEHSIFVDQYREFYNDYFANAIQCFFLQTITSGVDGVEDVYNVIRKNLIPNLFDSLSDFENYLLLFIIYKSENFNSFLLGYIQERENYIRMIGKQTVSKSSMDYKVGHSLLIIPRKIKRILSNTKV